MWKSPASPARIAADLHRRAADYAGLFRRLIVIILCWPVRGSLGVIIRPMRAG